MLNKLTTIVLIQLAYLALLSACQPLKEESNDVQTAEVEEVQSQPAPILINASDYSGSVSVSTKAAISCINGNTYGSSAASPILLSSLSMNLNDSCSFTFPTNAIALIYQSTNYYGISGSNTITSTSQTTPTFLTFSTTAGSSTVALNVVVGTANVFPSTGTPTFNFYIVSSDTVTAIQNGTFSVVSGVVTNTGTQVTYTALYPDAASISMGVSTPFRLLTGTSQDVTLSSLTTWTSSSPSVATVSSTGVVTGVAAGTTTITAKINTTGGSYSASALLTVRATTYLYISIDSSYMVQCSISATTLSSCVQTGAGFTTLNNIRIYSGNLYATDQTSGKVYVCPLNPDGTLQVTTAGTTACTTSLTLATVQGLTFTSSKTYVSDGNTGKKVYVCDLPTAAGIISNCTRTAFTGASGSSYISITEPADLVANGNYVYTVDQSGNQVITCTIDSNGALTNCVAKTGFSNSGGGVVSGSYLYVTNNASGRVSTCLISGTDGTLSGSTCSSGGGSTAPGSSPNGITAANGYLYVSHWTPMTIAACPVSGTTISACTTFTLNSGSNVSPTISTAKGMRGLIVN
ncbi:MAG: Ig-like domain-containing protein [Bdellovibrionota bacterium]